MARKIPRSEGGRDGTSLNVGNDIVGKKPKNLGLDPHNEREVVRENSLSEVFELRIYPPDVAQDMSSRIEHAMTIINYMDPTVPTFEKRSESTTRQSRRQVAADQRPRQRRHLVIIVVIHYIHLLTE